MPLVEKKKPQRSPLDRRSGIPLYHQIQQRLMDQVKAGEFKSGQPLPSIQKIAERLGVSPMTVRQAIKSLCDMGVLYSRQGKGTFISGITMERDFRQVLSFSEEMKARGAVPRSEILSFNIQAPNEETVEALALSNQDKVFCLRRVRYADSLPLGIETSCLPVQLCPDLLSTYDPTTSLYMKLSEDYGIQVFVTDEIIEVGKASAEVAKQLQIDSKSPVFFFTRISYLENGMPAEHVKSIYRGDHYRIVNRLMRSQRELHTTPIVA
jgi:GntR family transcriptional regulator